MAFSGCEKFFIPLLTNLVGRLSEPSAYESASSLLASPCVPSVVIHSTARVLLYNSVSGDASNSSEQMRTLLSQVRQRHPDVVEQVSQEIIEEDDDLKEKVEQLILSLSLVNIRSFLYILELIR
jgi:U3 small nucleolar RNA-associated protein 10